ncbi:MAG: class I adenylate cyclase [Syntrophales bacterium]|nr:class I adenylate cyclase [Syntrophales bacterium]
MQNKKTYLAYNDFRKAIFSELSPRDADVILYLLPWMLSVNDPAVPGYVPQLTKRPIMVYGITDDQAIIDRDAAFKKMFNIVKPGPLMRPLAHVSFIQGLYTIGSAGTISQTPSSDCDIWVCINKEDFHERMKEYLSQKINLIKDWIDANLKMPVFFFICDVEDIRNSNFGSLDEESSGSAQRNVLKEEFYRTSILISGKIPLWWVCFDPDGEADYQALKAQHAKRVFDGHCFIDMGSLISVDSDEYFGAALWQFNKALTHPLKSVIKMLLLEMLLAAPQDELLCHHFRDLILGTKKDSPIIDPSMFTLKAVLEYKKHSDPDTFSFIRQCCYLRNEIRFNTRKQTVKEKLSQEVFADFPLSKEEIDNLNSFATWPLLEHLEFGDKMFALLMSIYKEIKERQEESIASLTKRDMIIVGRKLAVCLERKQNKLTVVHKPIANLRLPNLTFIYEKRAWHVVAAGQISKSVITDPDIIRCITYLVWNDMYHDLDVRMAPNPTPITLQEINNLAKGIKEVFGVFDITKIDFENFLEPELVTKMFIIINFESSRYLTDVTDFGVLYANHWGELFFQRFNNHEKFKTFIENGGGKFSRTEMHYYVQRDNIHYEKLIERTKKLVTHIFKNAISPPAVR